MSRKMLSESPSINYFHAIPILGKKSTFSVVFATDKLMVKNINVWNLQIYKTQLENDYTNIKMNKRISFPRKKWINTPLLPPFFKRTDSCSPSNFIKNKLKQVERNYGVMQPGVLPDIPDMIKQRQIKLGFPWMEK